MFNEIGRMLVIFGAVILVIGAVMMFSDKIPFLGRLPGDFVVRRRNFVLYFPLATGIILSILLTVILNLVGRK